MQRFSINKFPGVLEKRKTDSVAVEINVKTGSINEYNQTNGISHFIEHLLFKETKNRDQKEIYSTIENLGGELNAFTDQERTAFHVKILKKHFNTAVDILSDVVLNPTFPKKEIEHERKVILREMNMYEDTPMIYQQMLLPNKLFQRHPLKNMIIGTKDSVFQMTKEQILDYYQTYYNPSNICISIVGNPKNPLKVLKKYLKPQQKNHINPQTPPTTRRILKHTPPTQSQKKPKTQTPKISEPPLKKPVTFIQTKNMEGSYLSFGFRTTSRDHKDSFPLDIISTILGEGASSRLFQEIREKKGLVYAIKSENKFIHDMGYFMINTGIKKENIPKAKKIIFEEIKKLSKIKPEELKDAKTKLEGNYLLNIEDNEHLATALNYWSTNTQKPELTFKYPELIKQVTIQQIKQAVKTYLNPNAYAQVTLTHP